MGVLWFVCEIDSTVTINYTWILSSLTCSASMPEGWLWDFTHVLIEAHSAGEVFGGRNYPLAFYISYLSEQL